MRFSDGKWAVGSRQWAVVLISVVLLVGCGGVDRLETVPKTGTVTLDGVALQSGSVIFYPERGPAAKGVIQPDGTFSLMTYEEGDGAVLGLHRVAVICRESQGEASQETAMQGEMPLGKSLIPVDFSDPDSSGLTATIIDDGQEIELKLLSKPAGG